MSEATYSTDEAIPQMSKIFRTIPQPFVPGSSVSFLASRVSRGFGNQGFEELFDEAFHAVPLRVHVVARGVGVGVALVTGDLLHQVSLYEAVVRVEQGATEEA